jgi:hypothetical protein
MNTFSDMIACLAAKHEDFKQVIAVGSAFLIFTRAWVVADIAQGYDMGLPLHLYLHSAGVLHAYVNELMQLEVRSFKASRPEDAREILSAFPD